ncbi:MAG: phosphotransferase family protein [Flammeovirgaceae bacterium]
MLDQPTTTRTGEEIDSQKLADYLQAKVDGLNAISIQQYPSGYSNLTYLVTDGTHEFILRRPPFGANIKSAHDMQREFTVLQALHEAGYTKAPKPVLYCDDESIIGGKFYMMHRVAGVILRNRVPKGLTIAPEQFRAISISAIDTLVQLHQLDVNTSALGKLGKPEGYVQRQVEGWISRYQKAQTDDIQAMNEVAAWMPKNMPTTTPAAFIHNDFKYDNLVLSPNRLEEVIAVLDWEMATVGDPLMDLGTTLAYWAEASDNDALKPFNLTWMPGNLKRHEVAQYYGEKSGTNIDHLVFYYVFGSFKVAVICQQIYHRYKQGHTQDSRFAMLIHVIRACAENARRAIDRLKI